MAHGSKLDETICQEFLQNWDSLIAETNEIKHSLGLFQIENTISELSLMPVGENIATTATQRVGQSFFRKALLAANNGKCCFTGIAIPELLRASHIKPWSKSNDVNEKTNPQNGLLLNALHDAAFDKGYITITLDYRIVVSQKLLSESKANRQYFMSIHGQMIQLPSRFFPGKQFIRYHNEYYEKVNQG